MGHVQVRNEKTEAGISTAQLDLPPALENLKKALMLMELAHQHGLTSAIPLFRATLAIPEDQGQAGTNKLIKEIAGVLHATGHSARPEPILVQKEMIEADYVGRSLLKIEILSDRTKDRLVVFYPASELVACGEISFGLQHGLRNENLRWQVLLVDTAPNLRRLSSAHPDLFREITIRTHEDGTKPEIQTVASGPGPGTRKIYDLP